MPPGDWTSTSGGRATAASVGPATSWLEQARRLTRTNALFRCTAGGGGGGSAVSSATAVSMHSWSSLLRSSPSRISAAVPGVVTETDRAQERSPTRNRRPGSEEGRCHLRPRTCSGPRAAPTPAHGRAVEIPQRSKTTEQEKTRPRAVLRTYVSVTLSLALRIRMFEARGREVP